MYVAEPFPLMVVMGVGCLAFAGALRADAFYHSKSYVFDKDVYDYITIDSDTEGKNHSLSEIIFFVLLSVKLMLIRLSNSLSLSLKSGIFLLSV